MTKRTTGAAMTTRNEEAPMIDVEPPTAIEETPTIDEEDRR